MSECLTESEVAAALKGDLAAWEVAQGKIRREFRCNGWRAAVLLFNGIAHLAEAAWHHPDVEIGWGRVVVSLTTHSAGGITHKDLALAREIERFAGWRPAEGSALEGAPREGCWRYLEGE